MNYQKLNHIKRNDSNKDPSEGKQLDFSPIYQKKKEEHSFMIHNKNKSYFVQFVGTPNINTSVYLYLFILSS